MAKSLIEPGAILDGFTIGECVHHGGMATLWSVTHPDMTAPLLMKIPRVAEGEDPAAIVSFEMEHDDPAAPEGAARAGLFRHRRFRPSGLCRDRVHSGRDALSPAAGAAACL